MSSLALLTSLANSGKIPFEWILRVLHNSRSLHYRAGKGMNFISFPVPEMERVISAAVKAEDLTKYEPFRSNSFMFEER
jgi:hypothetical protein